LPPAHGTLSVRLFAFVTGHLYLLLFAHCLILCSCVCSYYRILRPLLVGHFLLLSAQKRAPVLTIAVWSKSLLYSLSYAHKGCIVNWLLYLVFIRSNAQYNPSIHVVWTQWRLLNSVSSSSRIYSRNRYDGINHFPPYIVVPLFYYYYL